MIYLCPLCSQLHEMGSDHLNTESCTQCYKRGPKGLDLPLSREQGTEDPIKTTS